MTDIRINGMTISKVALDRSLAICEFGMRNDAEGGFSESDQAEVRRRILLEVGPTQPAFLVWYSLYDQLNFLLIFLITIENCLYPLFITKFPQFLP